MDGWLSQLVRTYGGVLGAPEAVRAGVTTSALSAAVKAGELVRVRRGGFVEAGLWRSAPPDARYALTVRATLAARDGAGAASHHAALVLHGLPIYGYDTTRVDLVAHVKRTTTAGRVVVHPQIGAVVETDGGLATDIATALVHATAVTGVVAGVVSADRALATRRCSMTQLHEAAAAAQPLRAHRRLARMLALLDARSESVAESRARLIFIQAGLTVRSQVKIADPGGAVVARADLLIGEWVVVEVDGAGKYADDPDGRALFREKLREDRLRELGYEVVRVTWADLADPARLIVRVRAAMARAEVRHAGT